MFDWILESVAYDDHIKVEDNTLLTRFSIKHASATTS